MFKVGDVVALRSGGEMMTVAGIDDDEVTVVWMGEEGELFRDNLPFAVLMAADLEELDVEDEDESEDEDDTDEEAVAQDDEDDEDAEAPRRAKKG